MKKNIVLLLVSFFMFYSPVTRGQGIPVIDVAQIGTLAALHNKEFKKLEKIKDLMTAIVVTENAIKKEMELVKDVEKKTFDHYKLIQSVVKTAGEGVDIINIGKDIFEYQKKTKEVVEGNVELLVFALEAEKEILKQANELKKDVFEQAMLDGVTKAGLPLNLMNNKERLDLLHHIKAEMLKLRAATRSLYSYMRVVKQAGFVQSAFDYKFKNDDKQNHLDAMYESMIGINDDL